MTNENSRRSWIWQIAASLCCLTLAGCGGGGGSLPGTTVTYEGGAILGNLRVGELQLQRRSNQLEGTLLVTKGAGVTWVDPRGNATLPVGTYQLSATITGNNFSGQGRYLGSPAFDFTVNGVFPTSSTVGFVTIAGSTAQGAFNSGIVFQTLTGPAGQDGNFSFSNLQGTNANTLILSNTVNIGSYLRATLNLYEIRAAFNAPPNSPVARTLHLVMNKNTPFVVGEEVLLRSQTTEDFTSALVWYSENSPLTKQWFSASGSVKILSINGKKVTLQLINVQMQPQQQIGDPLTQGTGQFTLNGTGSVMMEMDHLVN